MASSPVHAIFAVPIDIFETVLVDSVDDGAQDVRVDRVQHLKGSLGDGLHTLADAERHEHAVHACGHRTGVGHGQDGWRIDEHEIEPLAKDFEQVLELRRTKELGRIDRSLQGGEEEQVRHVRGHCGVNRVGLAGNDRRQSVRATLWLTQELDQRRTSEVGIHQEHAFA